MWKLYLTAAAVTLLALQLDYCNAKPIQNLQVTLRGHKYEVSDVETVQELQEQLQKTSGVSPKHQGRVLFGGKRLNGSLSLEEAGVFDGAKLNLVPPTKTSSTSTKASGSSATKTTSTTTPSTTTATQDITSPLDTAGMSELFKSMGNGDGKPPDLAESMEAMSSMMNSPIFQEWMSDPEKLEESRQMILQNPLLKSMMAGMPGMEEVLNDPVAWRESMTAAANLYKNMDKEDLMKSIMGTPPPGIFDGNLDGAATALDELSEGED